MNAIPTMLDQRRREATAAVRIIPLPIKCCADGALARESSLRGLLSRLAEALIAPLHDLVAQACRPGNYLPMRRLMREASFLLEHSYASPEACARNGGRNDRLPADPKAHRDGNRLLGAYLYRQSHDATCSRLQRGGESNRDCVLDHTPLERLRRRGQWLPVLNDCDLPFPLFFFFFLPAPAVAVRAALCVLTSGNLPDSTSIAEPGSSRQAKLIQKNRSRLIDQLLTVLLLVLLLDQTLCRE